MFNTEEGAKSYVEPLNKEIYEGWLEYTTESDSRVVAMDIERYGSPEAYAKHMLEQEDYYYREAEVEE